MQEVNPWREVLKALLLFVAFNLVFAAVNPPLARLSIYNWLVKGLERLPSGVSLYLHNVSPDNLDAALASHEISGAVKKAGEYRVVILEIPRSGECSWLHLRFRPPRLNEDQTQFDVLRAACSMVGNLPVLVVNEPIFVATGKNSDVRYNDMYPRWVFDQFRHDLAA